ncbi:MAG: hypothetical protein D6797_06505 [Bdellovibrio sp.]|nr:MAG: hypothetical protein D6797_06505 [Bdellovibrio sp.]
MNKVNLSKDGTSIVFKTSESVPTSVKKFRKSPEIQGFYSFIYDNSLQQEAYEILCKIIAKRKAEKAQKKQQKKTKK